MIIGMNHITLSVKNLANSFEFYTNILGCKPLAKWETGAYLLAGNVWLALLVDGQVRAEPLPEYSHIAFSVLEDDFVKMVARLENAGIIMWQNNQTEGNSHYFLDPDHHKLEIHTTDWQARLDHTKQNPWGDIEFFV